MIFFIVLDIYLELENNYDVIKLKIYTFSAGKIIFQKQDNPSHGFVGQLCNLNPNPNIVLIDVNTCRILKILLSIFE
jgi:hypothetical protein